MPTYYTGYHIGKAGKTYYAKPIPTVAHPWDSDLISGIRNGDTNEIAFSLLTTQAYWVYEQVGSTPTAIDTVVFSFASDCCESDCAPDQGCCSESQAELKAQLNDIEAKLNSGVTSVTVDGTTTQINHAYLRKRANDLRKRIATENGRRPVVSSIYLGGF